MKFLKILLWTLASKDTMIHTETQIGAVKVRDIS